MPGWWCLTIRITPPAPRHAGAVRQRPAVCPPSPVPILHDFAYAAIGSAASDAPLSLFSQPDAKAWGVETYTFSKTFNMAGWRFGFAVGNASIIRAFKNCTPTATARCLAPFRMQRSPRSACRQNGLRS